MKKVKFSKILSCILAVLTVVSALPAFAVGTKAATTSDGLVYSISNREATITGYTGSATELVIPSTIEGYPVTSIGNESFSWCKSLTSITIPKGITTIGNDAFYFCSNLESITIPDSVTSIGKYAFCGCSSLASITIPDGVTGIGVCAFSQCTSLTSITISDSVTSIGDSAFSYCTSLTSITIPEGVTSIGNEVFSNCTSLESMAVNEGNPVYHGAGNCIIETAKGTLIVGCKNSIIPDDDSVTSIGNYAFSWCENLTSITIPVSVASIGKYAFRCCRSLESITVPESITNIGEGVFESCSKLASITIPDSVTSIGKYAFSNCTSLASITISDSVTSIGSFAFRYCSNLATVYYGGSESNWSDISIESYNEPLLNAEIVFAKSDIPEGLEYEIVDGEVTIMGYTGSAAELVIPETIEEYPVTSIGENAFYNYSSLTSITIPDGVTSIGHYAFYKCSNLENINLPQGITEIGDSSFADTAYYNDAQNWEDDILYINEYLIRANTEISGEVVVKEGTKVIADGAFFLCESITGMSLPVGMLNIGISAFACCTSLDSITIPDSVTSIGDTAFYSCYNLLNLIIPSSVEKIGIGITSRCNNISTITVDPENPVYHSDGNCIIETATGTLVAGCNDSIIPDDGSVTSIGDSAFNYCVTLLSITIPESVTSIGYSAFENCRSLKSISIPVGITKIVELTFNGCESLTTVYYGGSESEWNNVFISTNNLPLLNAEIVFAEDDDPFSYEINNGVVTITGYTGSESGIVIPSEIEGYPVAMIGNWAFFENSTITGVLLPDTITYIGDNAFCGCSNLVSVNIPAGVTYIGNQAFQYCRSLTSITVPERIANIKSNVFYGCSKLSTVTIHKNVTTIGEGAFDNCSALAVVYYNGSREEWYSVSVGSGNDSLLNANIIFAEGEPDIVIGDINGDGMISAMDMNLAKRLVSGTVTATPEQIKAADMNGDGVFNGFDTNILMRVVSGSMTLD